MKKFINKTIATLVFIFLFHTVLTAQMRLGVKGGASLTGVSLLTSGNNGTGTGFNFNKRRTENGYYGGVTLDMKLGKSFRLQPSVLYSQKGWRQDTYFGQDLILGWYTTYKFQYIEVPIQFLFTAPAGNGRAYIGTGPYITYGLKGQSTTVFPATGGPPTQEKEIVFDKDNQQPGADVANRMDFGLSSVLGYEFNFGLQIEVGYDFGFREIFQKPEHGSLLYESKYSILKFGAGFMINRTRKSK